MVSTSVTNLQGLKFHAGSGQLFGMRIQGGFIQLVQIDPSSGAFSLLGTPLNFLFSESAIDQADDLYVVSTCVNPHPSPGACKFLTFSLPTGAIVDTADMLSLPAI
jgi:hypothetical protein